eukprot:CAMPEP_0115009108 /NCGR_PEP_ID=MMETSP0216-20121206/22386_1 /TAXON_ID=223996 /ORGANISM="Protocruzia adherens, Strain Boccale" /LENGTH=495 /DNA_ID=CAMNT_0002376793 /DNA_START=31 /DNA_END=1518 /DNA_ORIENTATION=-
MSKMEGGKLSQVIPARIPDLDTSRDCLKQKQLNLATVRANTHATFLGDSIAASLICQCVAIYKYDKDAKAVKAQLICALTLAAHSFILQKAIKYIAWANVWFWCLHIYIWSSGSKMEDGTALGVSLVIPSLICQCVAIYKYDKDAKAVKAQLICALTLAAHSFILQKAIKYIAWANVWFWCLHIYIWSSGSKMEDGTALGVSLVIPSLICQCVAIYKYDKDAKAVKAQLICALTLAAHSFILLSYLNSFAATATDEEYKSLLILFPFHILLIEFILVRAISYPKYLENYDHDCGYGLAKIIISKLESLRLGFLMFTLTDELAATTVVSILISTLIEILTRTRGWLYALVAMANFVYGCWNPKVKRRFKVSERKFFYTAFVNSKYEVEYIPLLAALMIIGLGWAPIGTVGSVKDKWGTPVSAWYLPAWFYIAVAFSEVIADFGTALLTKYCRVDKIEFYKTERLSSSVAHHVWNLGMAFVTLCEMSLVFAVKQVED